MVDIHNHILPNMDDGAKSIKQSLEIIKEMSESGVTDIIGTPHFILGSKFEKNNFDKEVSLENLKKELRKNQIKMNLYLGNEVLLNKNIFELLETGKILTLNNSRYLLVEFKRDHNHSEMDDLLYSIKRKNIIPILAHPERYTYYQKHPEKLMDLKESGVLFQCNLGSFLGHYGKDSKRLVKKLLKHHFIDFLSSDVHRSGIKVYEELEKIEKKYFKKISKKELKMMLELNGKKVIENEVIQIKKYKPFKKTIFGFWK